MGKEGQEEADETKIRELNLVKKEIFFFFDDHKPLIEMCRRRRVAE